ncbi:MAG: hypothetical protein QM788_05180 [Roseateles sp.]|uniref:hypothetical protein n=1 Tax=Roseateles sp. TaxID=1971397 RepID=UPI0039EBF986
MLSLFAEEIHGLPVWNWLLQALIICGSYTGAVLNSRLRLSGFYFYSIGTGLIAILHFTSGMWLLFVLDLLYLRINILGIFMWAKKYPDQCPKVLRRWVRMPIPENQP